jgi:hypothetical protein
MYFVAVVTLVKFHALHIIMIHAINAPVFKSGIMKVRNSHSVYSAYM